MHQKRGKKKKKPLAYCLSRVIIIRYLPTKTNRETRRLEKEVRTLILKAVEERKLEGNQNDDILQMILDASDSGQHHDVERFVVDNFKTIYLAAYETAAVSASWTLMLLASNPEWQDKARAEVLEICGSQKRPHPEMVRKMKTVSIFYL